MDTLIAACIVLVLTNISFAVLAEQQRRRAHRAELLHEITRARQGEIRKEAHEQGLFDGYKRGWGEAYAAALKAEARGLNALDAIVRVGKLNAPALLTEQEQLTI